MQGEIRSPRRHAHPEGAANSPQHRWVKTGEQLWGASFAHATKDNSARTTTLDKRPSSAAAYKRHGNSCGWISACHPDAVGRPLLQLPGWTAGRRGRQPLTGRWHPAPACLRAPTPIRHGARAAGPAPRRRRAGSASARSSSPRGRAVPAAHARARADVRQRRGLRTDMAAVPEGGGGDAPPDPAVQRAELGPLLAMALKPGESWYLVDSRWFKQWKKYVGFDSWDMFGVGEPSLFPGPIDNSGLFSDPETQSLKEHLIDELDYVLVPTEAWNKLVTWYGCIDGQEPIVRKSVGFGHLTRKRKSMRATYRQLEVASRSQALISHGRLQPT
ncbi:ubiquitin carboxyl-terminal hydrolase 4 isoform X6 [Rhea pennata]|uniref:ubiquitin carboxyl-terminal hydrolase 4 isoform X6 n=1 Tax=Rhea pennata TaxID=8795 RepID=UPI002E2749DC